MCLTGKAQATNIKNKGQLKMIQGEQNLRRNTRSGTQAKTSKKFWETTDTGQKMYKKIQDLLVYS